jgi:signal transduction histidine kinase
MIHEALVNVARHAAATSAAVQMHQEDEALRIVVTDDGRGFGFSGRRDHRTLSSLRAGPRSLRERVAALGGTLAVDSSDRGARLELIVPLAVARP